MEMTTMLFDVWDSESANIVGAFASQGEALDALGRSLMENGPSYVSVLVLGVENDVGDSEMIATGSDLVQLVQDHLGPNIDRSSSNGAAASATLVSNFDHTRR